MMRSVSPALRVHDTIGTFWGTAGFGTEADRRDGGSSWANMAPSIRSSPERPFFSTPRSASTFSIGSGAGWTVTGLGVPLVTRSV